MQIRLVSSYQNCEFESNAAGGAFDGSWQPFLKFKNMLMVLSEIQAIVPGVCVELVKKPEPDRIVSIQRRMHASSFGPKKKPKTLNSEP